MHGRYHDLCLPPRHDLDLRQQAGLNGVGDEIREAFLEIKRCLDADDGPRAILDTDYQPTAGRVSERDHGSQDRTRRGEVTMGKRVSGSLLADARSLTLEAQAQDAAISHLQFQGALPTDTLSTIVEFESRVYASQQSSAIGGLLDQDGAMGGPQQLADSSSEPLGSREHQVGNQFAAWEEAADGLSEQRRAYRASVARGARIFQDKTFLITDSLRVKGTTGFNKPVRSSCAFCHAMPQVGSDVVHGQVDIGTTTVPFADPQPHLPLFRIRCLKDPHPFYGRTILTHDPGYALTSGRCEDIGKITVQSMRGLAARAPYFSNGTAQSLRAIIDYFDRRYQIGYTAQEKQDLVALLSAL